MSLKKIVISLTVPVLFYAAIVASQSNAVRRCYQFTWLGPRFNNDSVFLNATCQEATRLARGVPCMHPLVVSYDGTWPDVEYIWTNHADQASCVLSENDVCAKFTYFFDGHGISIWYCHNLENSTYMCTRGVDTNGISVNSGCYEQKNGSFATRVCFCRSVPGGVPCNDASTTAVSYFIYFCAFIFLLINRCLLMK